MKTKEELVYELEKVKRKCKRDKKITNQFFLIIYGIVLVFSILLFMGYQDIIITTVPGWNLIYIYSNLVTAMFALVAIILNVFRVKLNVPTFSYKFVLSMLSWMLVWTIVELYVLFFHHVAGGIMFRILVNFFVPIALVFRLRYLNSDIEEGYW